MEVGSIEQRKGHFSNNLDPCKRICFSSFFSKRSSLQQSAKGESDFVSNYPSLANTITVSTTVTTHSASTIAPTKNSEYFIKYKQKKASLDRAGKLTTSGVDSLMERLQVGLVLEDSVALITNARRSGTNAHYESAWRKWHSWSSKRKVYPIKFSVNKILRFLTKCFNIGFEHCTISGFRSVILAYRDPINGIPIGKESWLAALLVAVYNIRPPQPRYTFIWDIEKVIDFLATSNFPSELSLKHLTLKLTMLLALTSAARASEIGFVKDPRYLNLEILSSFIFLRKIKIYASVNAFIYTLKRQKECEDKIHSFY